ncbi:MAG: ATP-binding protein [Alphaproteobacteria bacterium]|nr:ATP-binding protein [Alphaproteobacteria bacterium]
MTETHDAGPLVVDDPALAAVRALISAMPRAAAVLDEQGAVLAANARYRIRMAQQDAGAHQPADAAVVNREHRAAFSPDGVRGFTFVTYVESAPAHPATRLLMTIANTLPIMLNVKDRQSRYVLMNNYQAAIYGTTQDGAIGQTAGELLGADYGAYTGRIDAEVMASGNPTPFYEESYQTADGMNRRWLTSKIPVADAAGVIWGVATVAVDISDRARLEEALRQAKEQAEAASRAKSGFLAAMSHELRTPLNAVIGFSEIMHSQALGPLGSKEYIDYAGHILSSGQHLLSLINDVLDFARIESGSLNLNIRPLDLGALLKAALGVIARTAQTAGVALDIDLAEQKVIIRADSQRLRQIVVNVAGNAVKFTPRGGRVAVTMRPDMRGGAVITFTDSGVGIAEADLPNVFQPFWQADSGLDRLKEGAGIGLPLSRQLVALHGGRLELESRFGEGTKVTVSLPEHPDMPVR